MSQFVARILMAVVVVLATAAPASVSTMTMPLATGAADQGCDLCPHQPMNGGTSDQRLPCSLLACPSPIIALPATALLYVPAFARIEYVVGPPAHNAGVTRAPDPVPPRPILLG